MLRGAGYAERVQSTGRLNAVAVAAGGCVEFAVFTLEACENRPTRHSAKKPAAKDRCMTAESRCGVPL